MADSFNQQITDALTAEHLRTARVATVLRREVWTALGVLEADILASLKVADPTALVLLMRRRRAVETLMAEEVTPLITTRYARIAGMLTEALMRLARHTVTAVQRLVNRVTGQEILTALPSATTLRRAVQDALIPTATKATDLSATGADWWERQGARLTQRIGDQLLVSVSLEESLTQAVARIRGTSEQGFKDGLMERARQDAARLVQTQVTNAVSEAQVAVADANAEVIILVHSSIIDSRTSIVCLGRNGLRYTAGTHDPIGHSIPYLTGPPYHPACRSTMIPLLEAGGLVSDESLTTWLRRHGDAFQDALLGPTRAQMFRKGTLTSFKDLLDALTGRPLTLAELEV